MEDYTLSACNLLFTEPQTGEEVAQRARTGGLVTQWGLYIGRTDFSGGYLMAVQTVTPLT